MLRGLCVSSFFLTLVYYYFLFHYIFFLGTIYFIYHLPPIYLLFINVDYRLSLAGRCIEGYLLYSPCMKPEMHARRQVGSRHRLIRSFGLLCST